MTQSEPAPDRVSKWDRAKALAGELHDLLAGEAARRAARLPLDTTGPTLMKLRWMDITVNEVLELVDRDPIMASIDRRRDEVCEAFLVRAMQANPQGLRDEFLLGIEEERARRVAALYFERRKRRIVAEIVGAGSVRWGKTLTAADNIGFGMDERVIELPLALEVAAMSTPGRVLDAGAVFNQPYVRDLIDPPVATLVHFTQSGDREEPRFAGAQVSYVFGDLREMPFQDGHFDRIVCVSTLEHVGMDNSRYGGAEEQDPVTSLRAVDEMLRVVAPGGTLLITVPYGAAADRGWFRVFGPADVEAVLSRPSAGTSGVEYFRSDGPWVSTGASIDLLPAATVDHNAIQAIAVMRIRK